MTEIEQEAILRFEEVLRYGDTRILWPSDCQLALDALRRTTEDDKAYPCKVGDMVYMAYSDEDGSFIEELTVTEISTHRIWVKGYCFTYNEIGNTVFLTRQEAEAALGGGEGEA